MSEYIGKLEHMNFRLLGKILLVFIGVLYNYYLFFNPSGIQHDALEKSTEDCESNQSCPQAIENITNLKMPNVKVCNNCSAQGRKIFFHIFGYTLLVSIPVVLFLFWKAPISGDRTGKIKNMMTKYMPGMASRLG